MSKRIVRRATLSVAIATLLGAAAPLPIETPRASPGKQQAAGDELLYSKGSYVVRYERATHSCLMRGVFPGGSAFMLLARGHSVTLLVSSPKWKLAPGTHTLDVQFHPSVGSAPGARYHFDDASPLNDAPGVSTSLTRGTYKAMIDTMLTSSSFLATVDGTQSLNVSMADAYNGSLIATVALRECITRVGIDSSELGAPANNPKMVQMFDTILAEDARGWFLNRYDYGSVSNVTVLDNGKRSGVQRIRADYTYNGGQYGWVVLEAREGQEMCLRYWDFPNTCR